MASSASSPRFPSAARWNVSSVSRMQRATVALKSSFFVPKSRKMYGCEMPATFAIASVEAPCRPRAANSACAASRTASRRSSALCLVVVVIDGGMLVTTHYLVKHLGHTLHVIGAEAGVERQRERPLVTAVGAGERPLVAVGAEPVQRVRADLRLDPLASQRLERFVAPIELDHEGLPPVAVAGLRARKVDETGEPLGVRGGQALTRPQELLKPAELRDADRAEDVREPVVQARARDLELAAAINAVVAHLADALSQDAVGSGHGAALAGRDDLSRVERE